MCVWNELGYDTAIAEQLELCWSRDSETRPSMEDVVWRLKELLTAIVPETDTDLFNEYASAVTEVT